MCQGKRQEHAVIGIELEDEKVVANPSICMLPGYLC
jgi:hypothetical protein